MTDAYINLLKPVFEHSSTDQQSDTVTTRTLSALKSEWCLVKSIQRKNLQLSLPRYSNIIGATKTTKSYTFILEGHPDDAKNVQLVSQQNN